MTTTQPSAPCGFVLVDKPAGPTSHGVVAAIRRALHLRRVGHAGTLDPMATGVLILGVGRATRLLGLASDADKEYTATIRLGVATSTEDAAGEVVRTLDARHLTRSQIDAGVRALTGEIAQVPSSVSAIKVDGRRSYARVRAGEDVQLPPRQVRIEDFEVLAVRTAETALDLDVRVRCSSGTYIRALARDLGDSLGVGGHLTALRRTEAAGISVTACRPLAEVEAQPELIPPGRLVRRWLPFVTLPAAEVLDLSHGRSVPAAAEPTPPTGLNRLVGSMTHSRPSGAAQESVALLDAAGELVAVGRRRDDRWVPTVVLISPRVAIGSGDDAAAAAGVATTGDHGGSLDG